MLLLCLVANFGVSSPAFSHAASTSFLILELPKSGPVTVRWDLSLHDIVWVVFIDADYDGNVTWQEIQDAKPALTRALLAELSVQRGGAPCELHIGDFALATRSEQNFLSVAMKAECRESGLVSIGGSLFMSGDASQRVLLSAVRGKVQLTGVLSAAEPLWIEPAQPSAWNSFVRFVSEGIWHVLFGYDHIAFVLLLLLPSVVRPVDGKWRGATGFGQVTRDVVTIITAFTIAHSITLIASAFDLAPRGLWFPPLVEMLIAASILYMALENIAGVMSVQRRWVLAFAFGLVHGFGFSFALRDTLQFAGSHLVTSLLAFNAGVEIGQLLVLAVLVPLLQLLFRFVVAERPGTIILSAIVAHTAWHWTADRWDRLRQFERPALDLLVLGSAVRWLIALVVLAGAVWAVSVGARRNRKGPAVN